MVPGTTCEILFDMEVPVGQDIETGAFLVANHHGQRVLKLFAKTYVQHAGIERTSPNADSTQRGPWKEPMVVLGRFKSAVAVNMIPPLGQTPFPPVDSRRITPAFIACFLFSTANSASAL